jgi:iron-sulfur cluster insertion protein
MERLPMSNLQETLESAAEPVLLFTDSAAVKVSELIREEGNPNLKLRVFVSGGGCSGFQYLAGAEIDYKEDLECAQFVIRNPNATTTCGCGSSFSA